MAETSIQWTDHSINPIRARSRRTNKVGHYCEKLSHGCTHCYASTLQKRFEMPAFPGAGTSERQTLPMASTEGRVPVSEDIEIWLDESKLQEVLRRKKPTKYFWCDMTDLFGSWVPDEWIERCFQTMGQAHLHTHQVLTKRADRMQSFVSTWVHRADRDLARLGEPLPNVWLGVSVEDQARADERIPLLLQTPAAVRFLSCEPLLGPVDLTRIRIPLGGESFMTRSALYATDGLNKGKETPGRDKRVDLVIAGGESGQHARPNEVAWHRSLLRQCRGAGVAYFEKQLGSYVIDRDATGAHTCPLEQCWPDGTKTDGHRILLRDRKGGDLDEWPEDLRAREFPEVAHA